MKKQHIVSILILVAWIILILALSSGGWAQEPMAVVDKNGNIAVVGTISSARVLPIELQLDYLECSLDVSYAREALAAAQERRAAALAKANAWCSVKMVGHRLECAK